MSPADEPPSGAWDVDVTRPTWIVELNSDGHRLWYVRLLVQTANGLGQRPTVITSQQAVDSSEWRMHISELSVEVRIVESIDWRPLVSEAQTLNAAVIVPDADTHLARIAVAASGRRSHERGRPLVTALLMRPRRQSGARSSLAFVTKLLLAASARTRLTSVRLLSLEPTERGPSLLAKLRLSQPVQDPVSVNPQPCGRHGWLTKHGLPPETPLAVIAGELSTRKYVPNVLRALEQMAGPPPNLVLVGRLDSESSTAVDMLSADCRQRVHVVSGYVTDDQFDSWIAYADAVVLLHRNAGSSGVLLKAWMLGTPVIVGGNKAIRSAARELGAERMECDPAESSISSALARVKVRSDHISGPMSDLRSFPQTLLGLREGD